MEPLSFEFIEAIVQCFGRSFHYKDGVTSFFLSCGVPRPLVYKYRDQAKFIWARSVLTDLSDSEEGRLIQRRILTELCKLRDIPDKDVPDRNAGLDALRKLKTMAIEHKLWIEEEKRKAKEREIIIQERTKLLQERSKKLELLRQIFNGAISSNDRQAAGYSLEDLLYELFLLSEMEYRKSYRTPTQQIDGHFNFNGFDYLVEAKWRKDMPTEQEIGGFKTKVDSKLESTRGIFISVLGFRKEVIEQFDRRGCNIILMDGSHLIHILEGRIDLKDGLKIMIEKAAQEGLSYTPVSYFS